MMKKDSSLPQIGNLPRMNAQQLQALYRELFGAEHPIANCQHLRRKIAWHLQATKEGGLPESVRQYGIAIAAEQSCDRASRKTPPGDRQGSRLEQTA